MADTSVGEPRRRLLTPPHRDAPAAVRTVLAAPEHLTLAVQPIVDLGHATVAGYEVLARLPAEWAIRPDELFAAAAASGCSPQLTRLVLRGARRLRSSCPPNCFLTVNVSPADLADPLVRAELALPWDNVIIEVTEAAWPSDPEDVLVGVDTARSAGARIASDDAGAGYAGLLQLVRLRPDLIKVDRDLVTRLGSDPAADSVLRLLGELASQLDAWLLVEAVEEQTQLATALRLGVPLAQGWLFGRAAPPWPTQPDLSDLRQLRLSTSFTDTVVAFMRPPRRDEVACDASGRPHSVRFAGRPAPVISMSPSTPITAAVERALHRGEPSIRLAPVALTDGHGALLGLVDIEPLIFAVTRP